MLAQGILEYLQGHGQEFEGFLLSRFGMDDLDGGQVTCRADPANRRLLVRVTRMGSGQAPLWEQEFALKIEEVS
jgi:hypothetical protein